MAPYEPCRARLSIAAGRKTRHEKRMRKLLTFLIALVAGYLVGAFIGGMLVELLSGNQHDKSLEAQMTGAFVTGPLGAVIGLLGAALWRR